MYASRASAGHAQQPPEHGPRPHQPITWNHTPHAPTVSAPTITGTPGPMLSLPDGFNFGEVGPLPGSPPDLPAKGSRVNGDRYSDRRAWELLNGLAGGGVLLSTEQRQIAQAFGATLTLSTLQKEAREIRNMQGELHRRAPGPCGSMAAQVMRTVLDAPAGTDPEVLSSALKVAHPSHPVLDVDRLIRIATLTREFTTLAATQPAPVRHRPGPTATAATTPGPVLHWQAGGPPTTTNPVVPVKRPLDGVDGTTAPPPKTVRVDRPPPSSHASRSASPTSLLDGSLDKLHEPSFQHLEGWASFGSPLQLAPEDVADIDALSRGAGPSAAAVSEGQEGTLNLHLRMPEPPPRRDSTDSDSH